jgi:phosphoglucomutase
LHALVEGSSFCLSDSGGDMAPSAPSGTEDIYKIYAESFLGPDHPTRVQDEARAIVNAAFERAQ